MTENKSFRDSATPEERGIVLERLNNNETSAAIAFDMGLTLKVVCDIRNDALRPGELVLEGEEKPVLTPTTVQQYCLNNKLLTCATNEQYSRLFGLVADGFPPHDVATIVWYLSDTDKTAGEIEQELKERSKNDADNKSIVTSP